MTLSKITFLSAILILSGCGGDDEKTTSNVITEPVSPGQGFASLYAGDVSSAVYQNTPTVINLASSVKSSDGSAVMLANVKPLSDDDQCRNITTGNLNFTLDASDVGSCIYQYTISDTTGQVQQSAITQVAVINPTQALVANNNMLVSATVELGKTVEVELPIPVGYTLSESLTVSGAGTAIIDTTTETITYIAGSSEQDSGVSRVFFSYSDDDGQVLMGSVDVSVSSDTFNINPTAMPYLYVTDEDKANGKLYTRVLENSAVTIDLGALGLVADEDNDELQLIDVHSFNGVVSIIPSTPENQFSNLSFTFIGTSTGRYHVSYTVSDHHGGYATNIIEIRVEGKWPNVIVQETGDVFSAPLSLDAASIADYDYTGTAAELASPHGNGDKNVPTYTWAAANAICRARGGSLPTLAEFNYFLDQEGNPFLGNGDDEAEDSSYPNQTASNWPVERLYFTNQFNETESEKVLAFDPKGKYFSSVSSGEDGATPYLGYLACIDKTPQTLAIINPISLVVDVPTQLTAEFTTASGNTFPYTKVLEWKADSPTDGSVPIPDMATNVELGTYSGLITTRDTGFVKLTATDFNGELISAPVTVESVRNILKYKGSDPTFESVPDTASGDYCEVLAGSIMDDGTLVDYGVRYEGEEGSNNGVYNQISVIGRCNSYDSDNYLKIDIYNNNPAVNAPEIHMSVNPNIDYSQYSNYSVSLNFKVLFPSALDDKSYMLVTINNSTKIVSYFSDFGLTSMSGDVSESQLTSLEDGWFNISFKYNGDLDSNTDFGLVINHQMEGEGSPTGEVLNLQLDDIKIVPIVEL